MVPVVGMRTHIVAIVVAMQQEEHMLEDLASRRG